jgi:hypothetical protein
MTRDPFTNITTIENMGSWIKMTLKESTNTIMMRDSQYHGTSRSRCLTVLR